MSEGRRNGMATNSNHLQPAMMRKPNTGGIKSEANELRAKDIRALAHAKEVEGMQQGCVTVRLERGTLTARPDRIRHILLARGYKDKEIDNILETTKQRL